MKVCREKLLRMYITYSRETKTQYLHTQNNCYRLPNATLLLYEFVVSNDIFHRYNKNVEILWL